MRRMVPLNTTNLLDSSSVKRCAPIAVRFRIQLYHRTASRPGPEASEGRLGEHLVHRNVWYNGLCIGDAVLQTRHKVRLSSMSFCYRHYNLSDSIQTWALEEAKQRMEARGEKYKYEPSQKS